MRFRLLTLAALAGTGVLCLRVVPPGSAGGAIRRLTELKLATSKPGHVFSTDEHVKLGVAGMSDGAMLEISKSDAEGRSLGAVNAAVSGGVADLGEMPAGWYHLTAKDDASIDIAVARPRPVQGFRDDSPYGLVAPPHEADEWPLLSGMGAAWLQWSAAWAYMEVQPGVFWYMPNAPKSYGDPEGYVKDANKIGVRTSLQFRTVPPWASKGQIGSYKGTNESNADSYPPDEQHWDAFDKFVATVVERFKPLGVSHYEVWSEAEGSLFKHWETPKYPKIEAYQKMLQHTRKTIKEKDPTAQVMGPGDYIDFLKEAEQGYTAQATFNGKPDEYAGKSISGIGKAVDMISGHFYWTDWQSRPRTHWGPEEQNPGRKPSSLKEMIAEAQQLGGSRPVWITEVGYGSAVSDETPDKVAGNEDTQASLLVRYFLLSRAWGAKKTFWYVWKDRKAATGNLGTSYGLLRPDGTVKPSYMAYRTMTERLEGLPNIRVAESGPNRWIVHLTGPRTVVVVWQLKSDGKPEEFTLPWPKVRVTQRDGTSTVETPVDGKVHVALRSGEPVYLDQAP